MLHYWGYLVAGLIFMFGYAIFSGVSIMMAIPLLDNVFKSVKSNIVYTNSSSFLVEIRHLFNEFLSQHGSIFALAEKMNYEPFLAKLKAILSATDPMLLLWMLSISIIIVIILKNIFFYGNKIMFINLRGKTIKDIRNQIFRKYLYQSLAFFNKNRVGDSLVRLNSDANIVSEQFVGSMFNVLRDIFLLLVYARIALFLNVKLFLLSLILFPVFSIVVSIIGKKIKKYSHRIQAQFSNLFSNVEEILNSMKIVKAFAREDYEYKKFTVINRKFFQFWRKAELYHNFSIPLSEITSTLTGVVVLLIGGKQVLSGDSDFSLGSFIAFLLAIFSMLHPLKTITQAYTNIKKALVSLDRISAILNRDSEIKEEPQQIEKTTFDNKIELKNVSFAYENNKKVLSEITFTIAKGEKTAVVGSSGSGKTTLVNLLTRMYDVNSGEILIDGIPNGKFKLHNLRTLFGTVTQESILFSNTVKENIKYGTLKEVSDKEIIQAAQIAYADEFIEKMPHKYDEMLDIKASNLSGGQKQRLCIARAIVGNPPILIFDEATSSLDTESERKVQQAIERATENRTVIVIAHRLSTVLSADKIIVLDKGKIVCTGKHKELLQTCKRYQTLYRIQFADKKNN